MQIFSLLGYRPTDVGKTGKELTISIATPRMDNFRPGNKTMRRGQMPMTDIIVQDGLKSLRTSLVKPLEEMGMRQTDSLI